MTDLALIERITRSLAFMLRHQPETFDLELDPFGFADIDEVVRALNERLGEPVEEEDVREAVTSGDRPRYEIQGERIRALYGHSIPVEPGPSAKPPEFLFVAVPEQELERARRFGLRGGRRRFLHLALSKDDAAESGRRSSRDYTVLVIHALDAWEEGISFYDRVALWLAEEVPTHLIEVEGTYHDGTEPLRRFDGGHERAGGERERGHERHGQDRGGHDRGGRGRGGRGRGRDRERHRGRSDGRGAPERALEPRGAPAAPVGDRGSESFADERGREPREPQGQPAYASERPPERSEERYEGRREGGREERPGDTRSTRGEPREHRGGSESRAGSEPRGGNEQRPGNGPRENEHRVGSEQRGGSEHRGGGEHRGGHRGRGGEHRGEREPRQERGAPGGDSQRREPEPERREYRPQPRRDERPPRDDFAREEPRRERAAPLPSAPRQGAPPGGFGAGLEGTEERRERAQPSAPPPSAPPPRKAPPPPKNDGPGFGAGL